MVDALALDSSGKHVLARCLQKKTLGVDGFGAPARNGIGERRDRLFAAVGYARILCHARHGRDHWWTASNWFRSAQVDSRRSGDFAHHALALLCASRDCFARAHFNDHRRAPLRVSLTRTRERDE